MGSATLAEPLIHAALPYSGADDYVAAVVGFVEEGLDRGEPALVFAPRPNLDLVRDALSDTSDATLLDAVDVARNPARIIPAALRFTDSHAGHRVRIVGEGALPGRSPAAQREFARHEALVNVLFADVAASILCPYDVAGLDASVVEHGLRTHPYASDAAGHRRNPVYADPAATLSMTNRISSAPAAAHASAFDDGDLGALRRTVVERALTFGLSEERTQDLVLAVSEAAANTLSHTDQGGRLRTWTEADALVCEISDSGHIVVAHLAGRLAPPVDAPRGRGLWMINQLCDLVELRSDVSGTIIRMHIGIG